MNAKITFQKVTSQHKDTIFSWLEEPHVKAFWDNSQAHKDDILNFIDRRITPSSYCDGKYIYWIAYADQTPYAMIMTIQETRKDDIGDLKLSHLSKTGHTYGLDYMIGNTYFYNKGYGALTLTKFIDFFRAQFDPKADTFLIDPESENTRAKHVYEKAGFQYIDDFIMGEGCSGSGKKHHLLIKKFPPIVTLQPATLDDYPCIQNMARFYVYDASQDCGHLSDDWQIPTNGLFESFDFKNYFKENSCKTYFIKVYEHIAGFILLNQATTDEKNTWNIGEFFILARYQKLGIGRIAATKIWEKYSGGWEVSVIPENTSALLFWGKTVHDFTNGHFTKKIKTIDFDPDQPQRIIFSFKSPSPSLQNSFDEYTITQATPADIDAMNALSKEKRLAYAKAQPHFWKWAGEQGEKAQKQWFQELLHDKNYICLIAKNKKNVLGFAIGKIIPAPEVYDPEGLTLMIDDFYVKDNAWSTIGKFLLDEMILQTKNKNISQCIIVAGDHDIPKKLFLKSYHLSCASQWFVKKINA